MRWVVATAGPTTYVGQAVEETAGRLHLVHAFELVTLRMPQQTQHGGVGIATSFSVLPLGLCEDYATIRILAQVVQYFDEMSEHDRKSYEKLVQDTEESFKRRRAEAAGITLATSLPKGR